MVKLTYRNTGPVMLPHVHGRHAKDMIVLHETISPDVAGWGDIMGVENYLASIDYGIHGMTDAEGNVAWAYGFGDAIFWQCGGVNERSIGIEQVSNIPSRFGTTAAKKRAWAARDEQINATAKLVAAISRAHDVPLTYSHGLTPGVTTHWNVSQHFSASLGHTDCFPVAEGGYYPLAEVIILARQYAARGFSF